MKSPQITQITQITQMESKSERNKNLLLNGLLEFSIDSRSSLFFLG